MSTAAAVRIEPDDRFVYLARKGSHLSATDAQRVGERIAQLARETAGGEIELTPPAAIVEDAADPESPLHKFIWSETDEEAAHMRRLDLARRLTRAIHVKIIRANGEVLTRAFVHVRIIHAVDDGKIIERGYARIDKAIVRPSLRAQMLEDALNALRSWETKYASLVELCDVAAQVRRAILVADKHIRPIPSPGSSGPKSSGRSKKN
jgi:hypothetical protein